MKKIMFLLFGLQSMLSLAQIQYLEEGFSEEEMTLLKHVPDNTNIGSFDKNSASLYGNREGVSDHSIVPELNGISPVSNNKIASVAVPAKTDRPISKVAPNTEERKSLGQLSTRSNRADHRGLIWSIGYGVGYSSHAAAYFVEEDFRVKDFSGIRIIVLDSKIGWRFGERIGLLGTWKYAPGNATISPYRSTYFGGALAFYFQGLSIHGGLGTFQSKLGKDEIAGKGRLTNLGITLHLTNNVACELNVLRGKMEPGDVVPYLVDSTEFNFTVGMAYLF